MDDERMKTLSEQKFAEAITYYRSGQIVRAIFTYNEALQYNPQKFEAYANLSLIYDSQNNLLEATSCLEKSIQIKNDDPDLYYKLAILYIKQARNREGEECLKKVLLFNKNYWQALHALGMLFYDTQQYEYAIEYYQAALRINSSAIYSYVGLGKIYRHNNNLDKALHFFQEAVNHDPDNPVLHSLVMEIYLRSGNLYDGFIEHECRKRIPEANDFFKPFMALPQWRGEVFSGKKLLVHCEQGMGDTLQFIRYLPQVKRRGGFVAVLCQEPLLRLLENFSGIDYISDELNIKDFDLSVAVMSLPMIFGTTLNTIPNSVPYIKLDPVITNAWAKKMPDNGLYKVGLVWSGKSNIKLPRPFRLLDFSPLANVKNVVLYSLQKSEDAEQIKELPPEFSITDLTNNIDDFADTAGIIMNLDLVISIDTSVAHLAGALGKPTWIALPYVAEWRWLTEREDSPWYPTARLYRQEKEGDWNSVFTRMAEDLDELVNNADKSR